MPCTDADLSFAVPPILSGLSPVTGLYSRGRGAVSKHSIINLIKKGGNAILNPDILELRENKAISTYHTVTSLVSSYSSRDLLFEYDNIKLECFHLKAMFTDLVLNPTSNDSCASANVSKALRCLSLQL